MGATGITDIVDTVKTMIIIGVLFSIICAVVSAAREKVGVALEIFAYGYTLVAVLCLSAGQPSLLSAVLAIVVGALLGVLGYRISRMWIIITTGLVGGSIASFGGHVIPRIAASALPEVLGESPILILCGLMSCAVFAIAVGAFQRALGYQIPRMWLIITISLVGGLSLLFMPTVVALLLIIAGIYAQLKATAVPADKTAAQPAAVTADSAAALDKAAPSPARPKAARAAKETPPAGGQNFCAKCGKPLEPGVKFCGKCGHPTRSGEGAAKPK